MKTSISTFAIAILCVFGYSFTPNVTPQWTQAKAADGIMVYTRMSEGSPFKEIKATLTLDCSISTLVGVLTDYENYKNWIYSTSHSQTLSKISNTEFTMYQIVKTPWPLDNRDVCLKVKVAQDPKTFFTTVHSHAEPSLKGIVAGLVRVRTNTGSWEITPIAKNKVNCTYFLKTDPGGAVPAWILNMFISEGPYESLKKLKSVEVKKAKYISHANPAIKEKY